MRKSGFIDAGFHRLGPLSIYLYISVYSMFCDMYEHLHTYSELTSTIVVSLSADNSLSERRFCD